MKAVSVLLCLALAHGITASIFKQQGRPADDLDVLQQQYIDQYQRQHRNTPSNNQKNNQQTFQKRVQVEVQKHYQQRDQDQQQQGYQQTQQQQLNQLTLQNQQWEQLQKDLSLNSQEYQQPAYQQQYLSSQQNEYRQQYPNHQHHHSHHKHDNHQLDSASHESSQSSQESKERRTYYESENARVKHQHWNFPAHASAENQENQEPIDTVVWKSIQMSVVPQATVQNQEDIENIFGDAQRAMKHITEEDQVKFHQKYQLAKEQDTVDADLNATQLAQKHEYPVEEHTIKTDDGYVLTLFRIPPKKQIRDVQKRPVAFLMHGIEGSADDWLLMGPGKSLAYLLSDAGYDVWLGNARGNKYSKQHVSKNPAVSDFWQYSIDEIALHDLPAMIDYALKTTNQEKLFYIGHSQGTTAFFALTATRPEYNEKIIMMYALSPMAYMTNVRSPLFRMISPASKFHQVLEQQIGNGAFTPKKDLIRTVGGAMLEKATGCKMVSSNVNFVMAGVNADGLDAELIPVIMRHLPAGTSTKVIKQYGQGVASQEFRRYDYGPKINQKVYGTEQPPKYDMEKVQAPVTLYYSEEDWLAHPTDVERLQKELPNVREMNKVPDEHFSNMDFQFSTKAPQMVYRQLIESMENNQSELS